MLIALTGATGFVGRHVADALIARGHAVRALARHPERAARLAARGAQIVSGDLSDADALRALAGGADVLVHLVGIIVETGAATFAAVHVEGTRAALAAARAAGVRRVVHMSAVGARNDPTATRYHRTKWQAEQLVRESRLPHVIFRPSLVNGPENVPIRILARLHHLLPAVPVFGDGTFPTQPVWVGDVAQAFALAVERAELMGTFELGGPQVLTYEEFVLAIGRAVGRPRRLVHLPLGLVRAAARGFDVLGPAAPITTDQLQMLVEGSATPGNAITSAFGIKPLAFDAGLRRWL